MTRWPDDKPIPSTHRRVDITAGFFVVVPEDLDELLVEVLVDQLRPIAEDCDRRARGAA